MGRKSRLKRERQLEDLADRLEEGEFEPDSEPPWRGHRYPLKLYIRTMATFIGGIVLVITMKSLWPAWDRSVVTACEAVGLLFCGFQGWEAKKARRPDVAKVWFLLGFVVVGIAELWHWKPEVFAEVFRDFPNS